ncbi:hypothetical protein V2G26_001662 [Clonostachys chloroleuca]
MMERITRLLHGGIYAAAGIAGFVVMGSNGEALHLSIKARSAIIRQTRSCLDGIGKTEAPIIAGCSDQSCRGTVHLCRKAALAGSDYALVLPPSYFRDGMSLDVNERFFIAVTQGFIDAGLALLIIMTPTLTSLAWKRRATTRLLIFYL